MPSLKWGLLSPHPPFPVCLLDNGADQLPIPREKSRTADVPDKQAAKKNVKNGKIKRLLGDGRTKRRREDPGQGTGTRPGILGHGSIREVAGGLPARNGPGVPATGQTVKTTGNNGQDNGDSAIEEEVDEIVDAPQAGPGLPGQGRHGQCPEIPGQGLRHPAVRGGGELRHRPRRKTICGS